MALSDMAPATGALLIAPPMMQDPNFRRTVVLLCEHGVDGSFGLILNRSISLNLTFAFNHLYFLPLFTFFPLPYNLITLIMIHVVISASFFLLL